jgi:hypothetical protein
LIPIRKRSRPSVFCPLGRFEKWPFDQFRDASRKNPDPGLRSQGSLPSLNASLNAINLVAARR